MQNEYLRSLVLTCLYTPGNPISSSLVPARWVQVLKAVRLCTTVREVPEVIRSRGLVSEALILDTPGTILSAHDLLERRLVLTAECSSYPSRWLVLLGAQAPPVLWMSGPMPAGPFVSVLCDGDSAVGTDIAAKCRQIATRQHIGVASCAETSRHCYNDRAQGFGNSLTILASGISTASTVSEHCSISFSAPNADQTFVSTTKRSELLAALCTHVIVTHARFKEGDAWNIALAALRGRKTNVLVLHDQSSAAHRALIALGGTQVSSETEVATALKQLRPGTVGSGPVCERGLTAA